jgi:hypothetical protein
MFRFENAFAQTTMLLAVMGIVIAICFSVPQLKKRLSDGMILILAGITATLVDGWGSPSGTGWKAHSTSFR